MPNPFIAQRMVSPLVKNEPLITKTIVLEDLEEDEMLRRLVTATNKVNADAIETETELHNITCEQVACEPDCDNPATNYPTAPAIITIGTIGATVKANVELMIKTQNEDSNWKTAHYDDKDNPHWVIANQVNIIIPLFPPPVIVKPILHIGAFNGNIQLLVQNLVQKINEEIEVDNTTLAMADNGIDRVNPRDWMIPL